MATLLDYETGYLQSIDQLPELQEQLLEFIWDIEDTQGGDLSGLERGGLFRQYSALKRSERVLRDKCGTRFKSLGLTDRSLEWLCGDNADKLARLRLRTTSVHAHCAPRRKLFVNKLHRKLHLACLDISATVGVHG